MTKKKLQSRLPVSIALGLLFVTIVAAYLYQSNKSVTVQIPAAVDQEKETSIAGIEISTSETVNEIVVQEAPATKNSAEPKTENATETFSKAIEGQRQLKDSLKAPLLETVRVETDGAVLMAGKALPNQLINILLDDDIIETVVADGRGDFLAFFDLPFSAKMRVLSIVSDFDGIAVYSEQQVIIYPAQIAAPIVIAELDKSQDPNTQLEKGSASQETVPEMKSISPETQKTSKPQNAIQKRRAADAAALDTQYEAKENLKVTTLDTQEAEIEREPVVKADTSIETNTASETIIGSAPSIDIEVSQGVARVAAAKIGSSKVQQLASNVASTSKTFPPEKINSKDGKTQVEAALVEKNQVSDVKESKTAVEAQSSASKDDANQAALPQAAITDESNVEPDAVGNKEPSKDASGLVEPISSISENTADAEKAPVVMIADDDGVRVVQSGIEKDKSEVALDTISYDDDGDVALTGRGKPSGFVRIYLDNTPISSAMMDGTGQWNTALSEIDPGIYTLRVDQLDPTGQVSSRLETPFKRESVETLQSQLLALEEPARINVVTVQPGNTLWAIARERYGLGILYVRVFEANRDKIRDENLIYPGQIFELPD